MIRNISRLAPLSEEPINEEDSNNCPSKAQTWKKWLRTHFSLQLFTKKSDLRILLSVLGCPLFPLSVHPTNPITDEVSLFFSSFLSLLSLLSLLICTIYEQWTTVLLLLLFIIIIKIILISIRAQVLRKAHISICTCFHFFFSCSFTKFTSGCVCVVFFHTQYSSVMVWVFWGTRFTLILCPVPIAHVTTLDSLFNCLE